MEIINNDWEVSKYGSSWEKNYTNHALEVRDGRGESCYKLRFMTTGYDSKQNGGTNISMVTEYQTIPI